MPEESATRLKEILAEAVRLGRDDRSAFLDRECTTPELRARAEELLAAHGQADQLFANLQGPILGLEPLGPQGTPGGLEPGERLSFYEILEVLGTGGMGVVYRARDLRLARDVAIKVLFPEHVADEARLARFEREARLLASVNHPAVAAIYSIDQVEERCFLVLELVEGETLAQRLARGLPEIQEVEAVFEQLVEGIAAAHDLGIAHRDLKPENVVLCRKRGVKILDFGIAKQCFETPASAGDTDPSRTRDGQLFGTIPYMSPEQASGKPVDRRSDLFSLGVVLYQMLSGRQPFVGESAGDIIASILRDDPPPIGEREVPPDLRRTLDLCLAKDAGERPATAGDLKDVLATPDTPPAAVAPSPLEPVVAVLPFRNLSGSPDQEYLADGITEDIVTGLAYWRWFPVIASNSTVGYKQGDKDARVIAEELGVRYLVHGSVRSSGERLRIHAELIDGTSGVQLWSQKYEGTLDRIFDLQDEIAEKVAVRIEPELARTEQKRSLRKHPDSLNAWDHCLRARSSASSHDARGLADAIHHARTALELDPASSLALSLLSSYKYLEAIQGWRPDPHRGFEESFELAQRAVAIDDGDWLAHAKLGMGSMWTLRDFESATEQVRRAVELNPSSASARHCLSCVLGFSGEWAESIPHLHAVLRLDPRYPYRSSALSDLALAHLMLEEHDRAISFAEQAIRTLPANVRAAQRMVCALGRRGSIEEARPQVERLLKRQPDFSLAYVTATYPFRLEQDAERFRAGLAAVGLPAPA